jgi:hypothetical protein
VVIGGAAWLSAHWLSAPNGPAAAEEHAAAQLAAPRSALGTRRPGVDAARPKHTPAIAVGDPALPSSPPARAEVQPTIERRIQDGPGPAGPPALDDDDGVAAAARRARPKDAPRVNPTSGELMWSARDVVPDGGRPDEPPCGGKLCAPGQFCCGPPACGRCVYPMAGPRCPSVCPGQKSN